VHLVSLSGQLRDSLFALHHLARIRPDSLLRGRCDEIADHDARVGRTTSQYAYHLLPSAPHQHEVLLLQVHAGSGPASVLDARSTALARTPTNGPGASDTTAEGPGR